MVKKSNKELDNLHRKCLNIIDCEPIFSSPKQIMGRAERLGSLLDLPKTIIKVYKYTISNK